MFWTILSAKAVTFFAVFVGSGAFLWLNGALASRFSGQVKHAHPAPFDWQSVRGRTLAELLKLMPQHVAWPQLVAAVAGILGILIAAGAWRGSSWRGVASRVRGELRPDKLSEPDEQNFVGIR